MGRHIITGCYIIGHFQTEIGGESDQESEDGEYS